MKTINPNMFIFTKLERAISAYRKCTVPCMLLKATNGCFFLDTAKEALEHWPKHYTLIAEK